MVGLNTKKISKPRRFFQRGFFLQEIEILSVYIQQIFFLKICFRKKLRNFHHFLVGYYFPVFPLPGRRLLNKLNRVYMIVPAQ
jgi:hypothetical protein